ncbi:porin [Blattabacterium cuenoti]|uniref:porin n=1 Tax=Blattabacterium cuenoti TaxID=1653831 RepID=UPI00311E3615
MNNKIKKLNNKIKKLNNKIKKMKKTKIIFLILFLGFFYPFHSFSEIIKQKKITDENYKDENSKDENSKDENSKDENSKDENSNVNVFLDYSSGIYSVVKKEYTEGTRFYVNCLNLEIKGKVNDKISYRFTKQLVKERIPEVERYEILDLAYLKYKWNDKLYFLFGKQPFSFGSMEYADGSSFYEYVYRYPHVYKKNNKNNYVGFSFIYHPTKDHEFKFQVINEMKPEDKEYRIIQEINYPMGYSVNWNWSMNQNNENENENENENDYDNHDHDHDKTIKNRWSYSIFQENENKKYWQLLALGSKLNWHPITVETDYILSDEDLEQNRHITNLLRLWNRDYYDIVSVKYGTYLIKLKYNFLPKWNFVVKGVYETGTSKTGENDILGENKLFQQTYTYYGGIEFVPIIKNNDINFFLAYKNSRLNYSLDQMKKENENDHFIFLGLNYRVKMI